MKVCFRVSVRRLPSRIFPRLFLQSELPQWVVRSWGTCHIQVTLHHKSSKQIKQIKQIKQSPVEIPKLDR